MREIKWRGYTEFHLKKTFSIFIFNQKMILFSHFFGFWIFIKKKTIKFVFIFLYQVYKTENKIKKLQLKLKTKHFSNQQPQNYQNLENDVISSTNNFYKVLSFFHKNYCKAWPSIVRD